MNDNSDAKMNMDGYISVTPMKADLTDYENKYFKRAQMTLDATQNAIFLA